MSEHGEAERCRGIRPSEQCERRNVASDKVAHLRRNCLSTSNISGARKNSFRNIVCTVVINENKNINYGIRYIIKQCRHKSCNSYDPLVCQNIQKFKDFLLGLAVGM